MKNDLLLIVYIASLFGTYYISEKSSIRWTAKKFYDKTFFHELLVLVKMLIIILLVINTVYISLYALILIGLFLISIGYKLKNYIFKIKN